MRHRNRRRIGMFAVTHPRHYSTWSPQPPMPPALPSYRQRRRKRIARCAAAWMIIAGGDAILAVYVPWSLPAVVIALAWLVMVAGQAMSTYPGYGEPDRSER